MSMSLSNAGIFAYFLWMHRAFQRLLAPEQEEGRIMRRANARSLQPGGSRCKFTKKILTPK